jgi:hypothetical protein
MSEFPLSKEFVVAAILPSPAVSRGADMREIERMPTKGAPYSKELHGVCDRQKLAKPIAVRGQLVEVAVFAEPHVAHRIG